MQTSKVINSVLMRLILIFLSIGLLVSSCSTPDNISRPTVIKRPPIQIVRPSTPQPPAPPSPVYTQKPTAPPPNSQGYVAQGQAAWYGLSAHGDRTASGEVYDLYEMTAAHATLPLSSYVRVTNVFSGQSVTVKINDRVPSTNPLILLSYSAAQRLGLLEQPTSLVEIRGLPPQTHPNFP